VSQSYLRAIYLRLAGAVMLVVVLALAATAFLSHRAFERALAPEMAKKVTVGAASARALMLKAMEQQVAFTEIYGIEQTFDELKAAIPDIAYVAVTDTQGAIIYQRFKAPRGAAAYFASPAVLAQLEATRGNETLSVRVDDQYIVSLPIVAPAGTAGQVHVGVSVDFVNRIITDMLFDVLVVLVVALFFTLELLHFMAGNRLEATFNALGESIERGTAGDFTTQRMPPTDGAFGHVVRLLEAARARVNQAYEQLAREVDVGRRGPAHERPPGLDAARSGMLALARSYRFGTKVAPMERADDGNLVKVRAPLFTFILAEEMTRPFLPGFVKELLVPLPWLSPEIVVGLPIVLFMLIVALGQPFLGAYSERVGNRRAMTIGAVIAAVGFCASAFANNVLDLLLWRSLCAVGYGLVFVAAQAHVLEYSNGNNRARSFAVFIGAIMVATVCGPSIGGILADNIGERLTFGVSAALALASIAIIRLMPAPPVPHVSRSTQRLPKVSELAALLVNGRFMTLTGLAAIPAKILLTGMCFYLVPLYLLSVGSTQAVAGRVLMTYGVIMVVMMPVAAKLATTRRRMELLVGMGLVTSGVGGLLLLVGSHVLLVFAAVFLVGLGQSLSIAAQSALVREHCDVEVAKMGEPAVYGVYRLLERLGNAVGPIIAALLVLAVGYRSSFVVTGAAVACCGLLFLLLTLLSRRSKTEPRTVRVAHGPAT
jgi:predicted MFS family arabinose efflux permease